MPKKKRGSFNVITYDKNGRLNVVRRVTLAFAIKAAEEHSRLDDFNMAAVRKLPEGSYVGMALRGVFQFEQKSNGVQRVAPLAAEASTGNQNRA